MSRNNQMMSLTSTTLEQNNESNALITTEIGMKIRATKIQGCYELLPNVFKDDRGSFVKTFHQSVFSNHQLETNFTEEFYSVSTRNVLRGLHFQIPPADPTKIVYCVLGQVLDAIVDLRVDSPTYGQFELFDLSAEKANLIYMAPGLAHGFYVLSETAIVIYKSSHVYSKEHDMGIHWDSVGIPWGTQSPIISKRDQEFPAFANFQSPFTLVES
jgi:dTDP-4-dehydrorhamnose 3,5-epimerase